MRRPIDETGWLTVLTLILGLVLATAVASSCSGKPGERDRNTDTGVDTNTDVGVDTGQARIPDGVQSGYLCGAGGVSEGGGVRLTQCVAPVEEGGGVSKGDDVRLTGGVFRVVAPE